jgi:high-affinity nickel permease
MPPLLAILVLGFVLGMRHATDADHVVAAARFAHLNRRLMQLVSVGSIGFGLFLAYEIGVHDGIFSSMPQWTPR